MLRPALQTLVVLAAGIPWLVIGAVGWALSGHGAGRGSRQRRASGVAERRVETTESRQHGDSGRAIVGWVHCGRCGVQYGFPASGPARHTCPDGVTLAIHAPSGVR